MATTPGKEQQFQDEAYFVVADADDGAPSTFRRVPASNLPDLPALASRFVAQGYNLDTARIDGALYIAHRGGALMHPEHTMESYRQIVAQGSRCIELDCYLLKDGTLAVMHDSTIDRTTTSSGNVADFGATTWRKLVVDDGERVGGAWASTTQTPPLFSDVLGEFGNRVVLATEAKNTGSGAAIVAALQAAGIRPGVTDGGAIVSSFTLGELAAATAAGYYTQYNGTGQTPAAVAAAGVNGVALDDSTSLATIATYQALGLEVMCYTVDRHYIRDVLLAADVKGFYSDEPIYLQGTYTIRTTDPFSTGHHYHGNHQVSSSDSIALRKGTYSGGVWTLAQSTALRGGQLGWASPIDGDPDADTYTIDLSVLWTSATAADRWFAIDIRNTDHQNTVSVFQNGSAPYNTGSVGYRCIARKNGTMQIYLTDAAGSTLLHGPTGTSIADGATATYRLTVTPTTITWARIDVSTVATTSDTTSRGGYVGICNLGATVGISAITIS